MNRYTSAIKTLDLDTKTSYSIDEIRKQYKTMALLYHPDKNLNTNTTDKFQQIQHAYQFLLEHYDYDSDEDEDPGYDFEFEEKDNDYTNKKGTYIWFLYSFLKDIFHGENGNKIVYQIVEKILTTCEENALELLNKLDKQLLIKTNEFIKKYGKVLHISDSFIEKVEKIILEKTANDECIVLYPTLDDLFSNNLYRLTKNGNVYIVPLWHNELIYDNSGCDIYVQCEPVLPKNIKIDDNNNIITNIDVHVNEIWNKNTFSLSIGSNNFEIQTKKLKLCNKQTITLYRRGISRINTVDIYDISIKSDIIVNINLYL